MAAEAGVRLGVRACDGGGCDHLCDCVPCFGPADDGGAAFADAVVAGVLEAVRDTAAVVSALLCWHTCTGAEGRGEKDG